VAQQSDIIIIGAGIAGAALAHFCAKQGLTTTVFEKNPTAGGAMWSHAFPEAGGYWVELGAHTCYNSYGGLLGVIEDCGLLTKLKPREKVGFRFLVGNQVKSVPSQLHFFEAALNLPKIFSAKKEGLSVAEYYTAILGKKNYGRVLGHAFNAVMSQRANDLPAEFMFKKRPRRKDVLRTYTLETGVQGFPDAAVRHERIRFHGGTSVTAIEKSEGGFTVTTDDGARHDARFLACATPANVTARLLERASPALAEKISRIPVEKIETVGVVLKKEDVGIPPVAGLIAPDDAFYSAVSRDVVPDPTYRGFAFHFKPNALDNAAKLKRIADALHTTTDRFVGHVFRENVLPSLKVGHQALVESIDAQLAGTRLFITGNYLIGVSIEDCVLRSAAEFERLKAMQKNT
jgi:protoporphyrinogen oxidase